MREYEDADMFTHSLTASLPQKKVLIKRKANLRPKANVQIKVASRNYAQRYAASSVNS